MKITEISKTTNKSNTEKQIRVAAYARVSADKDAAFHSLEAQIAYYDEYIKQNPNYVLVDIYSDNGISGTTINRPEFNRMIEDCKAHKIDLVITKSITRFARNMLVLLETIRTLKELDVDIFFEKEQMHSISPDGELMLTLLAIYAEEEARSASENQKWQIKKKFERGEPWVGDMLGYRLIDGNLVVIPEEAEIVKMIFNAYLDGMGRQAIAKKLNKLSIPTIRANYWRPSAILLILRNEKYTGDMLLQKTYCQDFRTKKRVLNRGERRQYFVQNNHEAIIEPEIFNKVQEEIERRKLLYGAKQQNKTKQRNGLGKTQSVPNLFAGKIRCGLCGIMYHKRIANITCYPKPVWICNTFFELGKHACPSQQIPEDILIATTREVLGINEQDELDRNIIVDRIREIEVTGHFHLRYELNDGTVVHKVWKHKSRSKSWTLEMREKARQKALKRNAERRKNEAEENHDN